MLVKDIRLLAQREREKKTLYYSPKIALARIFALTQFSELQFPLGNVERAR